MTLEDFKDKKITVMGIGLHGGGVGAIKFFHRAGAKIVATDLRSAEELKESLEALKDLQGIEYVLSHHRDKDFTEADLVIKNPAVPDDSKYLQMAKEAGIKIETDIGVFFELCPGHIIGVTGSRGKSTTSTLIHHFLKTKYPDTILAGNIRASVLEKLDKIGEKTPVVLELSSWQLNGLASHKKSPPIAVVTNIMRDHMNRYVSMDEYIADKKIIFQFQKKEDFLILNADNEITRAFAPEVDSRVYFYSTKEMPILSEIKTKQESRIGGYLQKSKLFFGAAKEKIIDISHIKLAGDHNLSNILAAASVARLFDVPVESIRKVLTDFTGLEGRLQLIKEVAGVKYINDTTATIPEATIAAVNSIVSQYGLSPKKLILIAGGADKNLDFQDLARLAVSQAKEIMLLKGTATPKLEEEIKKQAAIQNEQIKISKFADIKKAVNAAAKAAELGDAVLLSPGCASFGLFCHEFERGEKFNQAVNAL